MNKDIDSLYEKYLPHKIGDHVYVTSSQSIPEKEWVISKYLIGGYEVTEADGDKKIRVETKYIELAEIDLKKVSGHLGHELVVSYVSNPNFDSYLYCRTCKTDVDVKNRKLPKPKIYFNN